MKILKIILCISLFFCLIGGIIFCQNNSSKNNIDTNDYLRIHIRANSNETIDQTIKYKIKDEFVNFLTPLVCDCENKVDVVNMIEQNKSSLESLADNILAQNNFIIKVMLSCQKKIFQQERIKVIHLKVEFMMQ